jgi:hypothetical protein
MQNLSKEQKEPIPKLEFQLTPKLELLPMKLKFQSTQKLEFQSTQKLELLPVKLNLPAPSKLECLIVVDLVER